MLNSLKISQRGLSKKDSITLFLACIFPIHLWSMFVFFGNTKWLAERGGGFALGVLAYFLSIAFVEAILLFLLTYIFGIVIPTPLISNNKVSFLSLTAWNICFGMILAQIFYSSQQTPFLVWAFILFIVIIKSAIERYFLQTREKYSAFIKDFVGRVEVPSSIFLGLDIIGIITVLIRNIL